MANFVYKTWVLPGDRWRSNYWHHKDLPGCVKLSFSFNRQSFPFSASEKINGKQVVVTNELSAHMICLIGTIDTTLSLV